MMKQKIAIIGGGASGLVAAIMSAGNGEVVLFEKDDRIGKKILQTGNGRCNFCNKNLSPKKYNNPQFVERVFTKVGLDDILNFFKNLGLCYNWDEEGRMYPASNLASSVLDVLRYECQRVGVVIKTNSPVLDIKIRDGKFEIQNEIFDKVVISSGNISNEFLTKLGISSTEKRQGLCSLKTPKEEIAGLAGIRAKVEIKIAIEGELYKEVGELQFKQDGLGGICVFDISSIISRKNIKNPTIFVDFAPFFENSALKDELNRHLNKQKNEPIENVFVGMFHRLLGAMFLKRCGILPSTLCKNVTEKQICDLVEQIKNCAFHIQGTLGEGQVRVGGISLDEVDENLMSKKHPNLYFVGECLDVDGLCGGYNLAWAWASAILVGEQI